MGENWDCHCQLIIEQWVICIFKSKFLKIFRGILLLSWAHHEFLLEWGSNRKGIFIFSTWVFDWGCINILRGWGCIQDWGCIQVDTVYTLSLNSVRISPSMFRRPCRYIERKCWQTVAFILSIKTKTLQCAVCLFDKF